MKKAFTIIEIVFVLVILGILAAVAVPRMGSTSELAVIGKGKADIATIRSAIVNERQTRLIQGQTAWISSLSAANTLSPLFDGNTTSTLLMYGIVSGTNSGDWDRTANNANTYRYYIGTTSTTFTYNNNDGTFTCVAGNANCDDLTQ